MILEMLNPQSSTGRSISVILLDFPLQDEQNVILERLLQRSAILTGDLYHKLCITSMFGDRHIDSVATLL